MADGGEDPMGMKLRIHPPYLPIYQSSWYTLGSLTSCDSVLTMMVSRYNGYFVRGRWWCVCAATIKICFLLALQPVVIGAVAVPLCHKWYR